MYPTDFTHGPPPSIRNKADSFCRDNLAYDIEAVSKVIHGNAEVGSDILACTGPG